MKGGGVFVPGLNEVFVTRLHWKLQRASPRGPTLRWWMCCCPNIVIISLSSPVILSYLSSVIDQSLSMKRGTEAGWYIRPRPLHNLCLSDCSARLHRSSSAVVQGRLFPISPTSTTTTTIPSDARYKQVIYAHLVRALHVISWNSDNIYGEICSSYN